VAAVLAGAHISAPVTILPRNWSITSHNVNSVDLFAFANFTALDREAALA
jgi:hypothetical protein